MPTYEYRCQSCGQHVEAFQRMSDEALVLCPNCGKEELHRVVSGGAGVIYRGEGWYVTDYSKKSSGGKEPPANAGSTPEAGASDATKKPTGGTAAPKETTPKEPSP